MSDQLTNEDSLTEEIVMPNKPLYEAELCKLDKKIDDTMVLAQFMLLLSCIQFIYFLVSYWHRLPQGFEIMMLPTFSLSLSVTLCLSLHLRNRALCTLFFVVYLALKGLQMYLNFSYVRTVIVVVFVRILFSGIVAVYVHHSVSKKLDYSPKYSISSQLALVFFVFMMFSSFLAANLHRFTPPPIVVYNEVQLKEVDTEILLSELGLDSSLEVKHFITRKLTDKHHHQVFITNKNTIHICFNEQLNIQYINNENFINLSKVNTESDHKFTTLKMTSNQNSEISFMVPNNSVSTVAATLMRKLKDNKGF